MGERGGDPKQHWLYVEDQLNGPVTWLLLLRHITRQLPVVETALPAERAVKARTAMRREMRSRVFMGSPSRLRIVMRWLSADKPSGGYI